MIEPSKERREEHLRREVIIVILTLAVAFTGTAAFRLSVPAVAFFTRSVLEASALGIGLLTSAFFTGRALTSPIAGGLADKLRNRVAYIATVAFAANAAAVYAYSLAGSIWLVASIRFIQGSLNGFAWVSMQYILGASVSEHYRGRAFSAYFILGSIGGISGNWIYSILSNLPISQILLRSSILFLTASALSCLIALSTTALPPSVEKRSVRYSRSEGQALRTSQALPLLLMLFATGLASALVRGDLIYVYFKEAFSLGRGYVAFYIGLASLIGLAVNYLLGWTADSLGDATALTISSAVAVVGLITISIKAFPLAIAGLIFYGAGSSSTVTISRRSALTSFAKGGTVIGLVNMSGNLGSVLGGLTAGRAYDFFGLNVIQGLGTQIVEYMAVFNIPLSLAIIVSVYLLRRYLR
jgi:MFS family permease